VTLAEPLRITGIVTAIFEKLQIPYYITGSLASSFHGIPRATADADLIAEIKPEHLHTLSEKLGSEFYVDKDLVQRAVLNSTSFNVIHLDTMFKIDVFIQRDDVASQQAMARRIRYKVEEGQGVELYLASAEDIILSKLVWYKAGGLVSELQWRDILGVLQVCSDNLDFTYLNKVAGERKIVDLLEDAIKVSGIQNKA